MAAYQLLLLNGHQSLAMEGLQQSEILSRSDSIATINDFYGAHTIIYYYKHRSMIFAAKASTP